MPVGAQEASTAVTPTAVTKESMQEERREFKEALITEKKDLKTEVQTQRETLKKETMDKREAVRKAAEEKRDEFRNTVETKRAELKKRIEDERVKLKERLAKIKDERKKALVEKIAKQLNDLNENRVKHFTEFLDKLDKVLDRIISRTDKAAEKADVGAVRSGIEAAKAAIVAAREAVKVQAAKTYTVTVTTEDKLKVDVGAARKALHDDLQKVSDAVKLAREKVHDSATTLAKIPRVDEDSEATSTPTNTQ